MKIKLELNENQIGKREVELSFEQLKLISKQFRGDGPFKDWDRNFIEGVISELEIAEEIETAEYKTDYLGEKTGNIAVEYKWRGNKSGLAATKAKFFCNVLRNTDGEIVAFAHVRTDIFKRTCRKYYETSRDLKGGDNNQANLILLPIEEILNPYEIYRPKSDKSNGVRLTE